jgi:chemotaxis protein methyltransferase CheR
VSDSLRAVAELVERETGIEAKESQMAALVAAIGRVSPEMGAEGFLAALNDPAERPVLLGRLIDQVMIQETFFMREPRELEAIDWHLLLAAAHSRGSGEVAVWVSACASGEEAYSVAMLAAEAFEQGPAPVSILATDISERALRRAGEGVYSERSMRDVGAARRERFFAEAGRRSRVGEQLRSMVGLRRHNLVAEESPPPGEQPFDLILCRNVLIYFGARTVESVVASLESALCPGGQLILGASDRLSSSSQRLAEIAARPPGTAPARPTPAGRRRPWRQPARAPVEPVLEAPPAGEWSVREAIESANAGNYGAALEATERILTADPLDADAHFVRGLAQLAEGNSVAAVDSLRRALYVDPRFALAAFQLGRAHDLCGDARSARRAYAQALRALDPDDDRHRDLLAGVELGDIAAACRARLAR